MFYSKISSLTFNNELNVTIGDNDIVLFVGANNVGKTQSLTDIYDLFGAPSHAHPRVISSMCISNGNASELKENIKKHSAYSYNGPYYSGLNYQFHEQWLDNLQNMPEQLRSYIVSYLKTVDRLSQVNPPASVESKETKTHPIHYLAYDADKSSKVSEYFEHAFGKKLFVNRLMRKTFPLCIGEIPSTPTDSDMNKTLDKWQTILDSYPVVHEQGDGIRSFTGIILNMIINHYGVFLIDEPESFLHPPQAYYLGNIFPDLLGIDRQAFISTHNANFINGLIEKAPDRVKIIRISREGEKNTIAILNNDEIGDIWKNPLLKYSNIIDGLFHKYVVLCESDSDCQIYSFVYNHICDNSNKSPETLFVHCGGKKRMKSIIKYLNSMSVEYRCVLDIDVLDDATTLRELYESSGGMWTDIEKSYTVFESSLNGGRGMITKKELNKAFTSQMDKIADGRLSKTDIDSIKLLLHSETKWSILKQGGVSVIPSGDGIRAYNEISDFLKAHNIFLVPVGELERFVPEVGGHGPSWSNDVIENYPDVNNPIYDKITEFVKSWGIC